MECIWPKCFRKTPLLETEVLLILKIKQILLFISIKKTDYDDLLHYIKINITGFNRYNEVTELLAIIFSI